MRLDKPIGTFLLLWPTLWALWLANKGMPQIKLLLIFIVGGFVMRSVGCVINDYTDMDYDGFVKRTKNRALVAGLVSKNQARVLIIGLLCTALLLVSMLNIVAIKYSCLSLALTCIYPFLKRVTNFVQFFLGLTFASGILMAFAATLGYVPVYGFILYFITIIWIVAYDTLYAMVDKQYDLKIGLQSTAILFGSYLKAWVGIMQIIVILSLLGMGVYFKFGILFSMMILIAASIFIYQQFLILDNETNSYFNAFLNNQWVGMSVFIGFIAADYSSMASL